MKHSSVLQALANAFGKRLKTAEEAAQAAHAALWNPACLNRPLAIVSCTSTADVQRAVQIATHHAVPLSVLGGGSHWAGLAVVPDGIVVDLRRMSHVHVDGEKRSVTFGGGSRINDVLLELPQDLACVTGAVTSVGYAGLTLGGGYGPLNSRFGLACDTLLSAEIVLAGGSVVTANAHEHPELLWALRGGGGNYGVVTAMELELFAVSKVQSATILFPISVAKAVYLNLDEIIAAAPAELSVLSGLVTLHDGSKGVFVQPLLSGESHMGEDLFERLCTLDGARVVRRRWSPYKDIFDREAEKAWSSSQNYRVSARFCETLSEEAIVLLVQGAHAAPTRGCVLLLHDFHGKASDLPLESAAYPLRKPHYLVEVIAGWNGETEGMRAREWFDDILERLSPLALPGGYTNVLGPEERARASDFYEPSRVRLQAVKKKYDPKNVFFSNVYQLGS